jgi:hypothetical protein
MSFVTIGAALHKKKRQAESLPLDADGNSACVIA